MPETLDIGEPTGEAASLSDEQLDTLLRGVDTAALDAAADDSYGDYLGEWGRALAGHIESAKGRKDFSRKNVTDDSGHEHADDGRFTGHGGSGGPAEKLPAPDPSGHADARERYEQQHAAWEARGEVRDRARALMDRANNDAQANLDAWGKIHDAHEKVENAGPGEIRRAVDSALGGWREHWDGEAALYEQAGATDAEMATLEKARTRAEAVIGRKAEAYQAQAEKFKAVWDAATELERAEPKEPAEKEYPPEPEQPDANAFADEAEFDKAYEEWEKTHDKWDEETQQIDEDNEDASDAWMEEHDRWEAKYDKANEKIDNERSKLDDKFTDLTDALDEHHEKLSDATADLEDDLRSRLDKEEEEDEEPEEPEEPEEDDEEDEDDEDEPRPAKSSPAARRKSAPGGGPESDLLRDFPDVRQPNRYACGASAACAVGRWYGVGPKDVSEWEKALGTTVERSTHPTAIVEYLKSLGLQVEAKGGMTVEDLDAHTSMGIPVIVCLQDYGDRREPGAEYSYGHYMVVLSVTNGMVICQDSSIENVEKEPGGDVPPSEAEASGNIAAPGRVLVPVETWNEVWHDVDGQGNKFVHFGIAVGPPLRKRILPRRIKAESYFATCDRDERGHCKPSGQSGSSGGSHVGVTSGRAIIESGVDDPDGYDIDDDDFEEDEDVDEDQIGKVLTAKDVRHPLPFHDVPPWLKRASDTWGQELTEEEWSGVHAYVTNFYKQLNAGLRSCPQSLDCLDDEQKKIFERVHLALDKAPPLEEPINVYRGVELSEEDREKLLNLATKAMETGEPMEFLGITSTSVNPKVAAKFGNLEGGGIVFEIRAKTGAYLPYAIDHMPEPELTEGQRQDLEEHPELNAFVDVMSAEEGELIQRHGLKYRVKSIQEMAKIVGFRGRRTIIQLEEV